jgi:hypothetical protein
MVRWRGGVAGEDGGSNCGSEGDGGGGSHAGEEKEENTQHLGSC